MASELVSGALHLRSVRWMTVLTVLAGGFGAASAASIYSCVDSTGKRLTSDRPIPECIAREQRVLNADGSTRQVVPPTMTADERADAEARERQKAARRAAEVDAVRRDRNLRMRYPNEASHQKARLAALDDLKRTLQLSQRRLEALAAEKKPLLEEAEFYVGRTMPTRLKQQLDGIDATAEAQRALIQNQQAETLRINASFDAELARLRKLWAGAPPGSLGPNPPVSQPASAAPSALTPASSSAAP
jgi:hypothetical protein